MKRELANKESEATLLPPTLIEVIPYLSYSYS